MIRSLVSAFALSAALAVPVAAQANTVSFSDLGTSGCGPTLAASYDTLGNGNGIRINLTVSTEQPTAVVLLFISDTSIIPGIPIDPFFGQSHNCFLYGNPVFSQSHRAHGGSYTWSRSLGSWWGTAYVQFAEMFWDSSTMEIKTTNLIEVSRPQS